jgi:hypothetical protein
MLNHDNDAGDVVGFSVETFSVETVGSQLLGPDDVGPEPLHLGDGAGGLRRLRPRRLSPSQSHLRKLAR